MHEHMVVQLHRLPVFLRIYRNRTLSIHKMNYFKVTVDQPETGVQAIIAEEDIAIGANTVIEYDTLYEFEEYPEFMAWLRTFGEKETTMKETNE